ncbi:MAG: carbohydrate-binding protein [Bacteroidales bacterium]
MEAGESGYYAGSLRVAAASATGQLELQTPDGDALNGEAITTPVTGGWQQWTSVPVSVKLEEGQQRLRVVALTGNYNLNWLTLAYDRPIHATVLSAATNDSGDTISVLFDKSMTTPPGKNPSGHLLLADGSPVQVGSVSWSETIPNALLLRLLFPLTADHQQITLSYADGALIDTDQQPVPAFEDLEVVNQVVTSLAQEEAEAFRIYPNPVGMVLNIEADGIPSGSAVVQIMDVTGKTVFMETYPDLSRQSPLRLETGSWNAGLYMIRITCGYEKFHQTVIKR